MHASLFFAVLAALAPFAAVAAPISTTEGVSTVEARAIYRKCQDTSPCGDLKIVDNSHHICSSKGYCDWACNSGYSRSSNKCYKDAVAQPVQTTPSASQQSSSQQSSSQQSSSQQSSNTFSSSSNVELASSSSYNVLVASGVSKFTGTNTGAIASWFHTNSPTDYTNGHSWCLYPYDDSTPGFAISLNTMLSDANWDANAAREKYCGLEAVITTPDGKSVTLYVTDAFDDTWVRTPTSIDVVYNAFASLLGYTTNDKNTVIQDVSWYFTGRRNEQYQANGAGN